MPESAGPPPASVIIGVDVGTTAVKITAFGTDRPWRAGAEIEYPLLQPQPGWAIQQPEVLAAATIDALARTVADCRGAQVLAISLSSAMHGLIGLDASMRPLTPLVTWADSRAQGVATELRRSALAAELHGRSGTPVHSMSPLTKLIWFRRHEPDLVARVRYWIGLKDWVIWSLTETLATELSTASGTGLLDLGTGTWSRSALDLAGVTDAQLPSVLDTTDTIGLSTPVAARIALPAGTPVVVGAGDGPLGNLGTGALDQGVAGLSIGTSGAVRAAVPHPVLDGRGGLFCYALTREIWVIGGAISNGGSVQRWAGNVFLAGHDSDPEPARDEAVLALAAQVRPGSDGLIALPYLLAERAPLWDPTISGAFIGIHSHHTRSHFVRACIEGVALQLWTVVNELQTVTPIHTVRATGGVFRSPLWCRILTDVLDRPVTVTDGADGSALGAAALGLVGIGAASSPWQGWKQLRSASHRTAIQTQPDPAATTVYRHLRQEIPALLTSYQAVAELFAQQTADP